MNLIKNMRIALQLLGFLPVVILVTPLVASAAVFYFDPNVSGGSHNGTQANPFNTLDSAAWAIINNALTTGDVTVYCSARAAGSDTNQVWSGYIDITQKTPNPGGTLTFDGRSFWNSNDSTPSWSPYSGTSRCQIDGFDSSTSTHTKFNKVVIDGFVIVKGGTTSGLGGLGICGDNWTIQNSDISSSTSNATGPLILIVPTSDEAHEGSFYYCTPSTNITIQNNTIHDSRGEAIYVGGAGCKLNAAQTDKDALRTSNGACMGTPSHSNITIRRNTITNCGSRGDQGDCIDLKAALTNVTISENDISNTGPAGSFPRCIVAAGIQTDGTNQNIVIERNRIHNCTFVEDGSLSIVQDWGTPNGFTVRNNIFDGNTGDGTKPPCVRVYPTQTAGVSIYNNTMYNCAGPGIIADSGSTVVIQNNALLSNNGGGAQTSISGTSTIDHNAYSNTWGGSCASCLSGLTSAAFVNLSVHNFALGTGSVLIDAGAAIASFSNDYVNTPRPQGVAWDVGAYEFTTAARAQAPSSPQNFRLQ